jgi:alpha-tubulin suppressor-like RCC1 family protein
MPCNTSSRACPQRTCTSGACGAADVVALAARSDHSCAIDGAGHLWCWGGDNTHGQLGLGSLARVIRPAFVPFAGRWRAVAAGLDHTCGVDTTGALWCWGSNDRSKLGVAGGDQSAPFRGGTDSDWQAVATSSRATYGIKTDGSLWAWGDNASGQLGVGDRTQRSTPTRVGTASWQRVSSRGLHACGIQADGSLWCWGDNAAGQLGTGGFGLPGGLGAADEPVRISAERWLHVAAGGSSLGSSGYTCGVREAGTLWCWGDGANGKLGTGGGDVLTPTQVGSDGDPPWPFVHTSSDHTCGLTTDGALWCWGEGNQGQLGVGGVFGDASRPRRVGSLDAWTTVQAGSTHTCAIRAGELWCWGDDGQGQLGSEGGDTETPERSCL